MDLLPPPIQLPPQPPRLARAYARIDEPIYFPIPDDVRKPICLRFNKCKDPYCPHAHSRARDDRVNGY